MSRIFKLSLVVGVLMLFLSCDGDEAGVLESENPEDILGQSSSDNTFYSSDDPLMSSSYDVLSSSDIISSEFSSSSDVVVMSSSIPQINTSLIWYSSVTGTALKDVSDGSPLDISTIASAVSTGLYVVSDAVVGSVAINYDGVAYSSDALPYFIVPPYPYIPKVGAHTLVIQFYSDKSTL